jgi:hypothetical protein
LAPTARPMILAGILYINDFLVETPKPHKDLL